MPSQGEWDATGDGEKALWLINQERQARGIAPLQGVESNVTGVAQAYAQYLFDHDAFSHDADGRTPWERLDGNPAIGACHDPLDVAENLANFNMEKCDSIGSPVEQAIYNWVYADALGCSNSWGHRHCILWYPYHDNSGTAGQEGFLGIGRANGPGYTADGIVYDFSEVIVMNVFDPCSSWVGPGPSSAPPIDLTANKATFNGDDTLQVLADVQPLTVSCYPFVRVVMQGGATLWYEAGKGFSPSPVPYLGFAAGPITTASRIVKYPILTTQFWGVATGTYYLEGGAVDMTKTTSASNLVYFGRVDQETLKVE